MHACKAYHEGKSILAMTPDAPGLTDNIYFDRARMLDLFCRVYIHVAQIHSGAISGGNACDSARSSAAGQIKELLTTRRNAM
jgi:hypothetical protein